MGCYSRTSAKEIYIENNRMIAHDGKKADMVAFATFNREKLAAYHLVATETTGRLLRDKVGLEVEILLSGRWAATRRSPRAWHKVKWPA